jgi:hypothetical protein
MIDAAMIDVAAAAAEAIERRCRAAGSPERAVAEREQILEAAGRRVR